MKNLNKKFILIVGSEGQIGKDLKKKLRSKDYKLILLDKKLRSINDSFRVDLNSDMDIKKTLIKIKKNIRKFMLWLI